MTRILQKNAKINFKDTFGFIGNFTAVIQNIEKGYSCQNVIRILY